MLGPQCILSDMFLTLLLSCHNTRCTTQQDLRSHTLYLMPFSLALSLKLAEEISVFFYAAARR